MSKLRQAVTYFNEHGTAAFFSRVIQELGPRRIDRHGIDEVAIVIAALDIRHRKGVMIDVGAHYGSTSSPFCEAGWQVYAFEPDSQNRAHLTQKIGHFRNIKIDNRALSNEEKESVTFYRSEQSTGISGLSAFHISHVAADTVAVTTLAQIVREHGIRTIDFLKIDTEGFDKFVLEGLPWDTHTPTTVVAEFEDAKTKPLGYDFDDFARFLTSRGYQVLVSEWEPIVAYGRTHTWADFKIYPCQLNSERAWGNFIATKDPQIFARIQAECARIKGKLQ
ncbi:MAG: FkbM family methyltransferase [Aquabacterium sp.]